MNEQELEFAEKLSEWGKLRARMDELETDIKEYVLEQGRSQGLGPVKAAYRSGIRKYNYKEAAVDFHSMILQAGMDTAVNAYVNSVDKNTEPKTDWKSVCNEVGIPDNEIPFTQGNATVKITLLKDGER